MRRRLAVPALIMALLAAFAAGAFADNPVKLFVNGLLVQTDQPPQLVNGRTMVPVRVAAEALGARVEWDEKTRSVWIDNPDLFSLQRQVKLLHDALAPAAPAEAVEKWARGVKERNGALQYAVLSPELKEKDRPGFESCGWVTGTSSPWVDRYETSKETMRDGAWEFEISFELASSTGPAGSSVKRVLVRQYDRAFYIAGITSENIVTG